MPFRERVKRAFGSRPSLSNELPTDKAATTVPTANATRTRPISHQQPKARPAAKANAASKSANNSLRNSNGSSHKPPKAKKSKKDEYADWPEHLYKPHEIPPPKYRRPPDSRHAARLNAYNFGRASDPKRRRKTSETSIYSPCGSRFSTRYHSVADHHVPIATIERVSPAPAPVPAPDAEMMDADVDVEAEVEAEVEDEEVATPQASGSRTPSDTLVDPIDADDDMWDHEHCTSTPSPYPPQPHLPPTPLTPPAPAYLTSSIPAPADLPPTRRGNVVSIGPDLALAHMPPLSTSPGSSADSDLDVLPDDDEYEREVSASPPRRRASPPRAPATPPTATATARPSHRASRSAARGAGGVDVDKRLPPVPKVAGPPRLKLPSFSHSKPFSGEDLIAALTRSGLDIEGMGFRNGDWDH